MSMVSVTCMSPRVHGEPCGIAGKCGRPSSAMLSLPEEPRILKRRTCARNSGGRCCGATVSRKVRRTSRLETTTPARISSPPASLTPVARPPRTRICSTGALLRSVPPLAISEAHGAVDAAHVVVQQHVGGAGRARPERGADDGAAGQMRLDDLALEIFIEQI